MSTESLPLASRTVAIPETRQLEVLAGLLEKRGASVLRCPLVAILDSADSETVLAWIDRFIHEPPPLTIFYTGEGVRRLAGFAERADRRDAFIEAIGKTTTLCRGPKPKRALRELGLRADIEAVQPTTAGIVETLHSISLGPGRIAVQLFGSDPVDELRDYLDTLAVSVDYVSPYVYASESDDQRVIELIRALQASQVDVIAFTSKAQVERLYSVARRMNMTAALEAGLDCTRIAAVGPVVAAELESVGVEVDIEPKENFSLKPLVTMICESVGTT
jgi:uroporphyrinogen-III synthase